MTLHPGQTVWYRTQTGKIKTGVATGHIVREFSDIRHELRVNGKLLLIRRKEIRDGEIERCRREERLCLADAKHNVFALLGARDWRREREIWERTV